MLLNSSGIVHLQGRDRKESIMKYHGFFLAMFVIFFLIWLVVKWLEWWKWNADMADRKAREIVEVEG